ncbi:MULTISPECIES: GH25 family lysozyme [Nitratireductor]|uniref:glycoside hydrolase family 25 protein n=1 Tax=Nitratireductor TaxID=245876 RepID=UPI000D0C99D9|nr:MULTISPECIES: GH25 family lysozyme [Nitratireductor]PSM20295.1 muramidase [Nitratireductor sp. StC3]
MRSPAIAALVFVCLALAACTTGPGLDALNSVGPSPETTSSIVRPSAVVPEGDGDGLVVEQGDVGVTALAEPDIVTAAAAEKVALIAPAKPASRPTPPAAGRKVMRQRFGDAHPINFGKVTPDDHAVHGVDVSRWQGDIDWVKLRGQGANFAWIKATDGGDHLDPLFKKNWRAAKAAGIPRGAYHFFYWCRSASSQADWFIRNVPKEKGALPPVLDVEWNHLSACKKRPSREIVLEKMRVFLDRLEKHYGQRPVIYTAPDFYADNLKGAFPDHPFWLRSVAAHPSKVYPGRKWLFWQYSGSGLSQGVDGRIDLNVFRGDAGEWRKWLGRAAG